MRGLCSGFPYLPSDILCGQLVYRCVFILYYCSFPRSGNEVSSASLTIAGAIFCYIAPCILFWNWELPSAKNCLILGSGVSQSAQNSLSGKTQLQSER